MNRLQEHLVRAGDELGICVVAPYELEFAPNKKIPVEAWLPQLGGVKGNLVVQSYNILAEVKDELIARGYGYSVYREPSAEEEFDIERYMEMFNDWGWTADAERKPEWID